jgi:predicted amidophosphoribosyltransferase
MVEFLLVFAVVFIVGFFIRSIYRAVATTKCPYCRAQVDKVATVCKSCGRDLPA